MADDQPTFGGASGATVQSQYMVRTMKCYPVQESEMASLATLNTEATIFFSLASGAISYAASIWINGSFAATLTDNAKVALGVAPIALAVGVICFLIALYQAWRRSGTWGRIKSESVVIESTAIAQSTTVMGATTPSTGPSLSSETLAPAPPSPPSP